MGADRTGIKDEFDWWRREKCDASSEHRRPVVLLLNFHGGMKDVWMHECTDGSF